MSLRQYLVKVRVLNKRLLVSNVSSFRPGSKLHRNERLLLLRRDTTWSWLLHHGVLHLGHHHLIRGAIKLTHLNVIHLSGCRVKHGRISCLNVIREKPLVHVHHTGVDLLSLLHHLHGFHLLLGHELLVVSMLRSSPDVKLVEPWLLVLLSVSVPHDVYSLEIVRSLFP